MTLTLTIFYDIPQLNVGMLFLMQADEKTKDPEKVRLTVDSRYEKNVGPSFYRSNATTDNFVDGCSSDSVPGHGSGSNRRPANGMKLYFYDGAENWF